MKVGILCENYFPTLGGEQEHIFNLRRHLESPRDGSAPVDVRIIVPHVAYDDWHGPADDDARAAAGAFDPRLRRGIGVAGDAHAGGLRRAAPLFARERFDLLHIHAPVDIGLSAWALWTFDGPIVGTIHSYFTHTWKRHLIAPWYRYVMGRMTRVIAVSEAARDAMARYARFDSTMIGNGVDCDAFQAGRPLPQFADGMTNILSVARLEPRNGIDVIIDAFALLARDRPALRLLLAGEGPVARAVRGAGGAAAGVDRLARCVSRCGLGGARGSVRVGALLRARRRGRRAFRFCCSRRSPPACASLRCRARARAAPGDHWSLAEMARSETPPPMPRRCSERSCRRRRDTSRSARAMARRHDWSVVVPRIRRVYEDALEKIGCQVKNSAPSTT